MTPHEIISACLIGLAISAVINSIVLIRLIGNVERLDRKFLAGTDAGGATKNKNAPATKPGH